MKKYIVATVVIVVLVAAGVAYFRNNSKGDAKSTSQAVAQLIGQKYNKPVDSVVISVQADTGSFAKGTVNFKDENGGGVWFAAKTAKGWELAADGNGIVSCDAVNKYGFPADMVPQCLDVQHNNNLITR